MANTVRPVKGRYAERMAPDDRREQLLDSALRVIVTQGVHKVSIDAVAKEAGVTRPVVYGHFEDSNALLRASLAREEQRATAQWVAAMAQAVHGTPVQAAVTGFRNFLDTVQASPDLWRAVFMLADSSTPQFRSRLELGREVAAQTLEELIRRAVGVGLDEDTDVPLVARMLLAVIWESGRLVLSDPNTYPPQRLIALAEKTIALHLDLHSR